MPDSLTPPLRDSQTKIVATVGPACDGEEKLAQLITAGVNVFRLNMAHANHRQQDVRLAMIRKAAAGVGRTVGVLVDLAGPKMRLGALPAGQLLCQTGDRVRFVRGEAAEAAAAGVARSETGHNSGSETGVVPTTATTPDLTTTYEPLIDEVRPGDRIMLADGIVSLVVEKVGKDSAECRVLQSGLVRSRQGVNLPGVKLSVAALNDVDRENAVWAATNDIDFVGLSFVRRPEDVRELKALLASVEGRGGPAGRSDDGPQVIAKIEKPEALEALVEVVAAADGVMVARGDLGVEIDVAQVAVAQKRIIAECRRQRKPVIVATQMLESMQHSRLPTRAEVANVSNAILDGANACMLSGETAVGEYPRETVEMMNRIALAAEPLCSHRADEATPLCQAGGNGHASCPAAGELNLITEAVVCHAGLLAEKIDAQLILVASASGATALSLAKNRFRVPTVGVSDSAATLRRMCLYWGVIPLASAPVSDGRSLMAFVSAWGKQHGLLASGSRMVLIAGTGTSISAHNMIVVHAVE